MCLIAMAIGQSEHFPWVCIANRDEFTNRPTAPMAYWSDHPQVLAGRDLQSAGSWMGVSNDGRVAMLTNIRNSALNKGENAPSRGHLINDFLIHGRLPDQNQSAEFSGFNLIAGNLKSLEFLECSNHHLLEQSEAQGQAEFLNTIKRGFYTLSNGKLQSNWPKTRLLGASLRRVLQDVPQEGYSAGVNSAALSEQLLPLLQDRQRAPDSELPNTGISMEWEQMLSAIQIVSPSYGTRSSTVMILDKNKRLHVQEVSYHPDGSPMLNQTYTLLL